MSYKSVERRIEALEAVYNVCLGACICRVRVPDGTIIETEFHNHSAKGEFAGFVRNVTLRELDTVLRMTKDSANAQKG